MPKYWTCRGCGHRNERVKQKCAGDGCNRSRPKRQRASHMAALDLTYDGFLELNRLVHHVDGEVCALCGRDRFSFPAGFRLDRDHDHRTGRPRGAICAPCNMKLKRVDDLEWLAAAMRYLARAELEASPKGGGALYGAVHQ